MSHPAYRLTETMPSGAEPLTLEEIKTFLRIDHSHEDAFVMGLISVARQLCENITGRSLITRHYSLFLDQWPQEHSSIWWDGMIEGAYGAGESAAVAVPKPPLLSIVQIKVYAADNTYAVFPSTNYYVDTVGCPGRIVLNHGASAPMPGRIANGIEIQFTAGYGATPHSVPVLLRQGMKQIVAHLYERRGDHPDQALASSGAGPIFQSYRVASLI